MKTQKCKDLILAKVSFFLNFEKYPQKNDTFFNSIVEFIFFRASILISFDIFSK